MLRISTHFSEQAPGSGAQLQLASVTSTEAPTASYSAPTFREVARSLAVSRSKVYGLMDAGPLLHVKLGRSRRIRWEDGLRLIEESTVGAEGGKG